MLILFQLKNQGDYTQLTKVSYCQSILQVANLAVKEVGFLRTSHNWLIVD